MTVEEELIKFINFLKSTLDNTNKLTCKRKTKISFRDIFFYLLYLIKDEKTSSVATNTHMQTKNYTEATGDAFIKKRATIDNKIINDISDKIINYYYDNFKNEKYNNRRILSTDGTNSQMSKKVAENGYKLTKNNTYSSPLINGLYDNENNIILDLHLSKKHDERKALEKQFKYLKNGDVLLLDRGYYSKSLLFALYHKNVDCIFRLKKNFTFLKNLNDKNDVDIQIKHQGETITFRLIKYEINVNNVNKTYFIGTTLINKNEFSYDDIKYLYKRRWSIEEYFKHAKCNLSLNCMHSKTIKLIKQEIHMHKCFTNITNILQKCYIDNLDKKLFDETKFKINLKNFILKIPDIVGKIIYKKSDNYTISKIIKILKILCSYLTQIIENRHFDRKRITPPSLWYHRYIFRKKG
jgi:hypothetical protein